MPPVEHNTAHLSNIQLCLMADVYISTLWFHNRFRSLDALCDAGLDVGSAAPGMPSAIETYGHAGDDVDEIFYQAVARIRWKDGLHPPSIVLQQ
jgi:hypothetical protein